VEPQVDLTLKLGRPPTDAELASILAMTVGKLRQVRGT
jgi:DNA-directed RNA polymerase specialized sigma subunit